jgi:hypothetical protein
VSVDTWTVVLAVLAILLSVASLVLAVANHRREVSHRDAVAPLTHRIVFRDVPSCPAGPHRWTPWEYLPERAGPGTYRRRCQRPGCPGFEFWHASAGVPQ